MTIAPIAAAAPERDVRKDVFFFVLFVALFLLVFREFFLAGRVFFERDTTLVEIPAKRLCVQLLKEGNFALWTDAHGNGQPFLANVKNGVFYPTTWLYLVLPLFTAFRFHYLIHVLLGWLGLYALCGSYGLSRRASFLGASLFAFSGMYLSSFEFYNHIAALAWMPWILWLLGRVGRVGSRRIVALAILWTLLILAGAPEFILMTLLLAAGQACLARGGWKGRIATAVVPLLVATALSAVQVLPSLELAARTQRGAQSAQWPLDLIQLVNLPIPHFFGDNRGPGHNDFWGSHLFDRQFPLYYSLYMGVGAIILGLFGLKRLREKRQMILLLLFFAFFLLSCGRYSPFFFFYKFVPLLSSIRYPVKFFLGAVFCMSILAAFGFDAITNPLSPRRKAPTFLAVTAAAGILLFWLFKKPVLAILNRLLLIDQESSLRELASSIGVGLVILAAYALLLNLLCRWRASARPLGWALLLLAVLDPAAHNRYVNPTVPASFYDRPPIPDTLAVPPAIYRDERYPPALEKSTGSSVGLFTHFRKSFYPFTGLGEGVRYVFNWDFYGAYPRRYEEIRAAFLGLSPEGRYKVLRYAGCTAHIDYRPFLSKETAERYTIGGVDVWIERIADPLASPFVAYKNVPMAEARPAAELLATFADRQFDPYENILTDERIVLTGSTQTVEPRAGRVLVREAIQGRGRYAVSLPREGIVVFPGNAAPGWRAWIDGRKAEVFEANLIAKGVLVPAGDHELVLRYLPSVFLWGAAISLVSVVLTAGGVLALERRARRKARRASL